jgi:DNA polymerase elongation subunit (family B)
MIIVDVESMMGGSDELFESMFPEPPPAAQLGPVPKTYAKKADEWRAEKHAKLVAEREENIRNAWEGSSLDALLGGVLCIGVARDEEPPMCIWEATEEATLRKLEAGLAAYPTHTIVGFNIIGFDIPFIVRRAMKYGLRSLVSRLYINKPWGARGIVDLRQVWGMGDRYAKGRLTDVAQHLGIEVKPTIDGKEVPKLWARRLEFEDFAPYRQQIVDHSIEDARVTRELAFKLEAFGVLVGA